MLFYCPQCLKEYEAEPVETVTTKSGRKAYKANCEVCGQDMAEFIPDEMKNENAQEEVLSAETRAAAENQIPDEATIVNEAENPNKDTE